MHLLQLGQASSRGIEEVELVELSRDLEALFCDLVVA